MKVIVDSKKDPDFSKYETYNFVGWQDLDDEIFSDADKKLLMDSFVKEFSSRGFKRVNTTGDMQVSIYVVTNDKTAYSGYNDYVGGYGGYSHYSGSYGYGYGSNNTYKQRSKMMGTLIMNIYDGGKNQIWQAVASSAVTKDPAKRVNTIPAKVSSIMKRFPVQPKK